MTQTAATALSSTDGCVRKVARAKVEGHQLGLLFTLMGQTMGRAQMQKGKNGEFEKGSCLFFLMGQTHFSVCRSGNLEEMVVASNLGLAQLILSSKEVSQTRGGNQRGKCTLQAQSMPKKGTIFEGKESEPN